MSDPWRTAGDEPRRPDQPPAAAPIDPSSPTPEPSTPWWYWAGLILAVVAGVAFLGWSIVADIGRTTARAKIFSAGLVTLVLAGAVQALASWQSRRR